MHRLSLSLSIGSKGSVAGTPALWTPEDSANVLRFWDFRDEASLTLAGSSVTGITDKIASALASQATASLQPTLNGSDVEFGTDDYLDFVLSGLGLTGTTPQFQVIDCLSIVTPSTTGMFLGWGSNTAYGAFAYATNTSVVGVDYGGGGFLSSTVAASSTMQVIVGQNDASALSVSVNGSTPVTGTALNPIDSTNGRIGAAVHWSAKTPHTRSGVVIGNNFTTDEIQKIEGFFLWREGQQAKLPGGHPYKSAPPTV